MSEEPERIWIDDERPIGGELHVFTDPPVKGTEEFVVGYIRADLAEAIVRAALEKAVKAIEALERYDMDEGYHIGPVKNGDFIYRDEVLAELKRGRDD